MFYRGRRRQRAPVKENRPGVRLVWVRATSQSGAKREAEKDTARARWCVCVCVCETVSMCRQPQATPLQPQQEVNDDAQQGVQHMGGIRGGGGVR